MTLLATEAATILLRTEPESLDSILPHLKKYGVFEDVSIEDDSGGNNEPAAASRRRYCARNGRTRSASSL